MLGGLALGAFVVACGDDDSPSGGIGTDGGMDAMATVDSGKVLDANADTDADADADSSVVPAKLYFVNAATALGPDTDSFGAYDGGIRVCFANSTDGATFAPAPFPAFPTDAGPSGTAGLFIGEGSAYRTSSNDLEPFAIRPYLMNAKSLKARGIEGADPTSPRCPKLLTPGDLDAGTNPNPGPGSGADLVANKDYWQLPDIPAGALKKNHTYILAVTGCTNNAAATPGACGNKDDGAQFVPTFSLGAGNLKILVLELDTTTSVAADEFAVAVANLSPSQTSQAGLTAVGPFNPRILNSAEFLDGGGPGVDASAGTFKLTAESGPTGTQYDRAATAPSGLVKIRGVATTAGYFAFSQMERHAAKLNNVGAAIPQTTVQFASTGSTETQQRYINGGAYTFVLVGNHELDETTQGSHAMHVIGFPNKE